jgi:hypothetical protein
MLVAYWLEEMISRDFHYIELVQFRKTFVLSYRDSGLTLTTTASAEAINRAIIGISKV